MKTEKLGHCAVLCVLLLGVATLAVAQSKKAKRYGMTDEEVAQIEAFMEGRRVDYRGNQSPGKNLGLRKRENSEKRELGPGIFVEWFFQYYEGIFVRGTSLTERTHPDGTMEYRGTYYLFPSDYSVEFKHTQEEIEVLMQPVLDCLVGANRIHARASKVIDPLIGLRPAWKIDARDKFVFIDDARLVIYSSERRYSHPSEIYLKRLVKLIGKSIHNVELTDCGKSYQQIKKESEERARKRAKERAKRQERSSDREEPPEKDPSSRNQSKQEARGQGLGWNSRLRQDLPILKKENFFGVYKASMRSDAQRLAVIDFSKVPYLFENPDPEECFQETIFGTKVIEYPCLLLGHDETTKLRWLVSNPTANSMDWGDHDPDAVDLLSHLWEVKQWFLRNNNQFRSFLKPEDWIIGVRGVGWQPIEYVTPEQGASFTDPGDVFLFGDTACDSPRSREIVGHEFFHRCNSHAESIVSDIENNNYWPGSIDEGVGDIMGIILGRHAGPSSENPDFWVIGDEYPSDCAMVRYIDDPQRNPREEYASHYCERQVDFNPDFPDPHFNGTIVSLAYALLVQGGAHPQVETFPGPTIAGTMDDIQAARIFYHAVTTSPTRHPTIFEFRQHTLDVLPELGLSEYHDRLERAWDAVGVYEKPPYTLVKNRTKTVTPAEPPASGEMYRFELLQRDWYEGPAEQGEHAFGGYLEVGVRATDGTVLVQLQETSFPYLRPPLTLEGASRFHFYVPHPEIGNWYLNLTVDDPFTQVATLIQYRPWDEMPENIPQFDRAGAGNEQHFFKFRGSGNKRRGSYLTFTTSGGTGDLNIYGKRGSAPSLTDYDVAETGAGNDHSIQVDLAGTEPWYFTVHVAEAYEGVTFHVESDRCDLIGAAQKWLLQPELCSQDPNLPETNVADLVKFLQRDCGCPSPKSM